MWLQTTYPNDPFINEARLIRFFFDYVLCRAPKKRGRRPRVRAQNEPTPKKTKKDALLDFSVGDLEGKLGCLEGIADNATREDISEGLKAAGAPSSKSTKDAMKNRVETWIGMFKEAIQKRRLMDQSETGREDAREDEGGSEGEREADREGEAEGEGQTQVEQFENILREEPTATRTDSQINTQIVEYLTEIGYLKANLGTTTDAATMQAIQLSLSSLKQYVNAAVELHNTQKTVS
jgi:DNA-directed RNA polymerase specialized sigma54-like protein